MDTGSHYGNRLSPEEFFARVFADADARDERPFDNRRYNPQEFFAHLFGDDQDTSPGQGGAALAARKQETPRHVVRGGHEPLQYELELGTDGRIRRKLEKTGERSTAWEYSYDSGGRLALVLRDGVVAEEYAYDHAGRRIAARNEATGMREQCYAYDGDMLLRAGDEAFAYSGDGSLAAVHSSAGTTRYRYEHGGGMGGADLPDGTKVAYMLNELGQPLEKFVNGRRAERFRWLDPLRLGTYKNLENGTAMRFHYNKGRLPHSVLITGQGRQYTCNLGYDQAGTLKVVADRHGNLIQTIKYDSFGGLLRASSPALFIPIGFAGGLLDRHTGLIRFVFRDYDPKVGRFTAPDPLGYTGGDHDLFEYCVDDPVNAVDSWGLQPTHPEPLGFISKFGKWFKGMFDWVGNISKASKALDGLDNATESAHESKDLVKRGLQNNDPNLIWDAMDIDKKSIHDNTKDIF